MKHVCFVNMPIEYYSPTAGGAISTIIKEVATVLQRDGHRVTVLTRTGEGDVHAIGDVVDLGPIPMLRGFALQLDRVTRRLLGREHGGYEQYRRCVTRALRDLTSPVDLVIVFNDYISVRWLQKTRPEAEVVNWLQNDQPLPGRPSPLSTVLCCSDYIRDRAVQRGIPADRAFTALSGVDSAIFHPESDWLEAPRPIRVLTIGRLDPNKGHDAALRAVAAARTAGFFAAVTLAGARWWYGNNRPDPYMQALLHTVAEQDGTYEGLVPRAAIPALFRRHQICLVLSRAEEPFGLVALEAMASGCAVIASDRGGLPQACGGAADLVDPDDGQQVLACLTRLLEDPAALETARSRARARAVEAPWTVAASVLLARARDVGAVVEESS